GIYNLGRAMLRNLSIQENFVNYFGAGIYDLGGMYLENALIAYNYTRRDGAGVDVVQATTPSVMNRVLLRGNNADKGGAIDNYESQLHLTNVLATGNFAQTRGGGLHSEGGTTILTNVTISNNTSQRGDPRCGQHPAGCGG